MSSASRDLRTLRPQKAIGCNFKPKFLACGEAPEFWKVYKPVSNCILKVGGSSLGIRHFSSWDPAQVCGISSPRTQFWGQAIFSQYSATIINLSEVEEKYEKAMVANAQLDNEKNYLLYQIDNLKDVIEEQEEQLAEFYRENEEKSKELEKQKHMCSVLQHKIDELKEDLRQRDELIEKHGLVIIPDGMPNDDISHESKVGAITVVSQEAAQVLESAREGQLEVRLRKLADEKEELLSQVSKLKLQSEEERQKGSRSDGIMGELAGLQKSWDLQFIEMQRDADRQISEYKFKLSNAEQDITTLEQSISGLEGQVLRYKTAAENAEKIEEELKAEKRKLQGELQRALDKIEEMEMTNSHLTKLLEMEANRTVLLTQQ
ncbi:leucine-rich repeat flightless-interacting protein 2-like [Suncus etruscus]|uniref:leucine-rich repeat flightless-interacting protein 2-like n=1 Tax=Suncus etruscus TaxID=109475 RepID=UPI00210F2A6C|nr:leucine-rich repeat flightless-interacting protein 2-like [Suncus etruscus]